MANSTSILDVMGPGFFIFFQVDPPGSSGQFKIKKPFNRVASVPEEITNENDEAILLALLLLCDDDYRC